MDLYIDEEPETDLDRQLKEIYYNPNQPGSFGSVESLLRAAKDKGIEGVDRNKVEKFLRDQRTYTVHKQARKVFTRNKTIVKGIDDQWQADLADMQYYAKDNDGYKYILTVIDIFSKFAWAIPVKNKSAQTILDAFKQLFAESEPRLPRKIQTD